MEALGGVETERNEGRRRVLVASWSGGFDGNAG
jgi:hypothetical protein